jgi:C4-type Zn-finger protein
MEIDRVKFTPEEWRKILQEYYHKTNALCPICGTPIYIREVGIDYEEGKVIIMIDQVCENNECTYRPIKDYEIQIKP